MVHAAQELTRFQDHLYHVSVSVCGGAEDGVVNQVKDVHCSFEFGTTHVPIDMIGQTARNSPRSRRVCTTCVIFV